MFLDSDDVIHSEYLSILVELLEQNDADIAMCSYRKIKIDDMKIKELYHLLIADVNVSREEIEMLSSKECIILMFYKEKVMPYPVLKLYKISVIGDARFPVDNKLGEDMEFNLKVFGRSKKNIYGY